MTSTRDGDRATGATTRQGSLTRHGQRSAPPAEQPATTAGQAETTATGRFATSTGPDGPLRIHYETGGTGPPLLLISGWGGSAYLWPPALLRELERRHRVVRVSNRGTGRSDRVRDPFTIDDLAADVVAVLEDAGVDRANVLGHSMGGMIAQRVAINHPERVDRLVLISAAPPRPERVPITPQVALRLFSPPAPGLDAAAIIRHQWAGTAAPGFAERHPEVLDEVVARALIVQPPLEILALQWQAMDTCEGADLLGRIAAPTLVIHGWPDEMVPTENGRRLHTLIPGARYRELEGVGHHVAWEAPEQLDGLLRAFLSDGRP